MKALIKTVGTKKVKLYMKQSGYHYLHQKLRKNNKVSRICSLCKKRPKVINLANVTGIYDENIKNYKPMCTRCHRRFDMGHKEGYCLKGHKLTKENSYWYPPPLSYVECRICRHNAYLKRKEMDKLK